MIINPASIKRPDGRLKHQQLIRMSSDPDLDHSDLGALLRLWHCQTKQRMSANQRRIMLGVSNERLVRLNFSGWIKINYNWVDTNFGHSGFGVKEIFLLKYKVRLKIFAIEYSRKGAKQTHKCIITAENEKEALERFQWAWPNHVVKSLQDSERTTSPEDFKEQFNQLFYPPMRHTLPPSGMYLRDRRKRHNNFEDPLADFIAEGMREVGNDNADD